VPVLPTLNLRFVLIALILVWLISFPAKGVFFQFSLYLLPILVLAFRQTRLLLKRDLSIVLLLSVALSLPLFLSELWSLIFNGGALGSGSFDVFWRLAMFCDYSRFSNRKLQSSLVMIAAIYGLAGIGSLLLHVSLNGRGFSWRAVGIVSNPNPFGFLMVAAALVAVQCMLRSATRRGSLLFMLAFILLLVAGFLSGSRSAWLGMILGLLLLLVLQRKSLASFLGGNKKIMIFGGAITLFLVFFSVSLLPHIDYFQQRIQSLFSGGGDIRLQIWQHYLGLVGENPFLGTPLNAENKFHYQGMIHGPHNMYLSVLVHSGIIGLTGLLAALGWIVKRIICTGNKDRDLCLALLLLLCIFCFFNSSIFGNEMTQGVFALIVAMTLGGESSAEVEL